MNNLGTSAMQGTLGCFDDGKSQVLHGKICDSVTHTRIQLDWGFASLISRIV
ncbi:hypothetical protein HYDPIDRAFT_112174 [Hydnomerulius pinastri MD-312]|uniref:Uncharacterized protein n=1 Tax=Hydnomerulius pinastri MD-312 TaxID=994086 RepID=A0A0C9WEU4_9AGAM|nr:hypothetical protein HYDPIDRAFT_112174 [Hydnomerulius pinastri MD-312]